MIKCLLPTEKTQTLDAAEKLYTFSSLASEGSSTNSDSVF